MKTKLLIIGMAMLTVALTTGLNAQQKAPKKKTPIEITSDGANRYEAGIAYAEQNVVVRYGEDVIYADQVTYDNTRKEVSAKGNVRIFTDAKIYRGDYILYNIETKQINSMQFAATFMPLYATGAEVISPEKDHYTIRNGEITTHNVENPGYRVRANTMEIYPGDRVVLKNVTLYVGDVPVMWVPYFVQTLDSDRFPLEISAGASTKWGPYVWGRYGWRANQYLSGEANLAYFGKRGAGGGMDFEYKPSKDRLFSLETFNIEDEGTDIGNGTDDRPVAPEKNRYRYAYKHKLNFGESLTSTADINIFSDKYIEEDFFQKKFQSEQQKDTYLDAMYYDPNFTATVLARTQINNVYNMVERKPEFILEFKQQDLFGLPVNYEGQSSAVNFRRQWDGEATMADSLSYEAVRYDTYHQFLYPRQYFNWLNVTPRTGFRATYYDKDNQGARGIQPYSEDDFTRLSLNLGVDASFKASRVWSDYKEEKWGIDGLRHVVEPSLGLAFNHQFGKNNNEFRGFDSRFPSTRLQPLNYSLYNSIDSIDDSAHVRPGIRNKIQTKRDGENHDLIDWALYTDVDLQRDQGAALSSHPFSQIYNEVGFYPLPWLSYEIFSSAGIASDSFQTVDTKLTWQVDPSVELNVGNRYLSDFPAYTRDGDVFRIEDSLLITFGSFWRLNENWQFAQDIAIETEDGRIQEQNYTIYRDFSSWNMSFTSSIRDNERLEDEYVFYLSLTLKAFPQANLSVRQ